MHSTRYFEASFATAEWLLKERADDLTDEQVEAIETYHDTLCEVTADLWGEQPPRIAEKIGQAPRDDDLYES